MIAKKARREGCNKSKSISNTFKNRKRKYSKNNNSTSP